MDHLSHSASEKSGYSKIESVDISIDPKLFDSGVESIDTDGAKDDLGLALSRLAPDRVKKLKAIIIGDHRDLTSSERLVLDYTFTSQQMFEDLSEALDALEFEVSEKIEPPTQSPVHSAPSEKENEEAGEEERLLRDSYPTIHKKYSTSDAYTSGDAQSREDLASRLLEAVSRAKQSSEKPKQPEFTKVLAERFPGIYQKLEVADGWERLHPETRDGIAAGFLSELKGTDSAWVANIFENKYKNIILDISATTEQLKEPEHLRTRSYVKEGDFSGQLFGKDVRSDDDGNMVIPIYFDLNVDNGGDSNILKSPSLAGLIPNEYTPEWSAGRLLELETSYPEVYLKLTSGEHWDTLSHEMKVSVSDAFVMFLDKYPDRLSWITEGYPLSFMVSEEAKISAKKGESVLLSALEYPPENPDVMLVWLGSVDEVIKKGSGYTFQMRKEYVGHAVGVLRGIRPKKREQV